VLDRLRDRAPSGLPFGARSHLVWSNDDRTVWFGGWQEVPDQEAGARWHVDRDGLVAFAGDVWPRRGGWRGGGSRAAQLASRRRGGTTLGAGDDLAGAYVAVSLGRRGIGRVEADPLGFGLVYWGRAGDLVVVSSRAALAAELLAAARGGRPKRDVIGAGWLAYGARYIGGQTGFEGVGVAPEGSVLEIGAAGVEVRRPTRPPWRMPAECTTSPAQLLEEARDEMLTTIRTARSSADTPVRTGLTGGKDSRLVLALLLGDGSLDDVEFRTMGRADLPDVVIASEIAGSFGLRHVVNPGFDESWAWRVELDEKVRASGHPGMSSREIGFRVAAWMGSGTRNVIEPGIQRGARQTLLNGLGGELLRTNWPATGRLRSKAAAARFPHEGLKCGTLGLLRPEALAHYRAETHRVLFADIDDTDSPQDVVDAFYMRHWLRRWLAYDHELNVDGRRFPLYSITAVRLAFAVGSVNRRADWIHRRLIRDSCEQLLDFPLTSGTWSSTDDAVLITPPPQSEPAPPAPPPSPTGPDGAGHRSPPAPARTFGRDLRATAEAEDVTIFRDVLGDAGSHPIFEILDPVATRRALDGFSSLPDPHKHQVYGALTAAIWLGEGEIPLPPDWAAT
jgi:hypothetical protein